MLTVVMNKPALSAILGGIMFYRVNFMRNRSLKSLKHRKKDFAIY